MIEIYRRSDNGKDKLVAWAEDINHIFRWVTEDDIRSFGYTHSDRTTDRLLFNECSSFWYGGQPIGRYCYVAVDASDNIITPDRLIGMFRAQPPRQYRGWRKWRKRKAYGTYRHPANINEKRAVAASELDGVPVRARRNVRHLVDSWDDYSSWNSKNWKKQSKKKRQWM